MSVLCRVPSADDRDGQRVKMRGVHHTQRRGSVVQTTNECRPDMLDMLDTSACLLLLLLLLIVSIDNINIDRQLTSVLQLLL